MQVLVVNFPINWGPGISVSKTTYSCNSTLSAGKTRGTTCRWSRADKYCPVAWYPDGTAIWNIGFWNWGWVDSGFRVSGITLMIWQSQLRFVLTRKKQGMSWRYLIRFHELIYELLGRSTWRNNITGVYVKRVSPMNSFDSILCVGNWCDRLFAYGGAIRTNFKRRWVEGLAHNIWNNFDSRIFNDVVHVERECFFKRQVESLAKPFSSWV